MLSIKLALVIVNTESTAQDLCLVLQIDAELSAMDAYGNKRTSVISTWIA
jgi:hypothetical protein